MGEFSFAALRGTTLDSVIYMGLYYGPEYEEGYPRWFEEELLDEKRSDYLAEGDILRVMMTDETDEIPYSVEMWPGHTVTLRNLNGDIRVMPVEDFYELFKRIGPYKAALTTDCVEYFPIAKISFMTDIPHWVSHLIEKGDLVIGPGMENNKFREPEGDVVLSPASILVRNSDGTVRYYTINEFQKQYEITQDISVLYSRGGRL